MRAQDPRGPGRASRRSSRAGSDAGREHHDSRVTRRGPSPKAVAPPVLAALLRRRAPRPACPLRGVAERRARRDDLQRQPHGVAARHGPARADARAPRLPAPRRPAHRDPRPHGPAPRGRDGGRPARGGVPGGAGRLRERGDAGVRSRRCWASRSLPTELMDLLVGVPSPRLRSYRARWGAAVPKQIEATLPDGGPARGEGGRGGGGRRPARGRLRRRRPHAGFRSIEADEARRLVGIAVRILRMPPTPRSTSASRCWACARTAITSCARSSRRSTSTTTSRCGSARRGVTVRCDHPLVPSDGANLAAARGGGSAEARGHRGGGRDRDPQANPGGGGPGRGQQQRRGRAHGAGPPVGAGARALRASTRSRAAWGPTCPFSCWEARPWGWRAGTRSIRSAARSVAHVVLVDPGLPGIHSGGLPAAGRRFDTPGKQQ